MTPETEQLIKEFPELTEKEAKLIFIRRSAGEAFCNDEIAKRTGEVLKDMVEAITVQSMDKNDIAELIGKLELTRSWLAAHTQGLMKAYADEVEPKIKAKRKAEDAAKKAKKGKPKSDAIFAALLAAEDTEDGDLPKQPVKKAQKVKCPKCNKEVYTLKYHKC